MSRLSTSTSTRPVIVGSGLAGLVAARELAATGCLLVSAEDLTGGAASMWAQGGLAAAVAADDSTTLHAEDTWRAGDRAGDRAVIDRITAEAPGVLAGLVELGVPFDRGADGTLDLALEGGHSRPRVAHAGDHSGAQITGAVAEAVRRSAGVAVLPHHRAVRLGTDASGAVSGITVRGPDGEERTIATDRVILATGGLGSLFAHTTNPSGSVGSGVALAARAGARTDDLHLVQFHPTALDVGRDPMPLLTEALRGAGATLVADGQRFVDELLPRDAVSAAVWERLVAGAQVFLDARHVPTVRSRFPAVAALAAESGLDVGADLLPVRPAVHYCMGGVTTDAHGRTSVPGLWAAGEVSRTGLHGANRLASNSLLEAVVTGLAAARSVRNAPGRRWAAVVPPADPATVLPGAPDAQRFPRTAVRRLLDAACGVLRDGATLQDAVDELAPHTGQDDAYVAWMIARSALAHPHSVGGHRRTDVPQEVPA